MYKVEIVRQVGRLIHQGVIDDCQTLHEAEQWAIIARKVGFAAKIVHPPEPCFEWYGRRT